MIRVTSGQQRVPAGVTLVLSCRGAVCESTLDGGPGSLGRLHVTAVLHRQARMQSALCEQEINLS